MTHKNSKQAKIARHLEQFGHITSRIGADMYNSFNVTGIVCKLKKLGYKIEAKRFGPSGERQVKYTLLSTPESMPIEGNKLSVFTARITRCSLGEHAATVEAHDAKEAKAIIERNIKGYTYKDVEVEYQIDSVKYEI